MSFGQEPIGGGRVAHLIVLGNEKGGSGKSTTAMHVATALARAGHGTGVLDLDIRQQSLARYIQNRQATIRRDDLDIACPRLIDLPSVDEAELAPGEHVLDRRLAAGIDTLARDCAFIVIDCPGSHTRLSQAAHARADTLITPINDSFVDFDMLGRLDPDTGNVSKPGVYAQMVWEGRQRRAAAGQQPVDWVVLRNRMGRQDMLNKRRVGTELDTLSKRIGFRVVPGFSERVVFRELFPSGLTLLDLPDMGVDRMSMSNLAARNELRDLMRALKLPGVAVDI